MSNARPFVKWAGGKTSILFELMDRIPSSMRAYHEPFLGGGAMFFCLQELVERDGRRVEAFLSDTNGELMNAWSVVQEVPRTLLRKLEAIPTGEKAYYAIRAAEPRTRTGQAARFIFLNKAGYNGLYRVNRKGIFNVPWGKKKGKPWVDEDNIKACSKALKGIKHLATAPFQDVLSRAQKGDFVYFDPPYYPVKRESFRAYSAAGFGHVHHVRLRDVALELKKRGANVMISNSSAPEVLEIYGGGKFKIEEVHAARSINSKGDGRGKVPDLIIR